MVRRHWLGIVIFHLLAFVLGAVEAPVLVYLDQPWTARLVYGFYGLFCHQQPSRCLFLFGAPLAICSRCLAFYLSLLVFALAVGIKRVNPISLRSAVMLAGPAALDVFLQAVHLTESTNLIRLTTGLLLGMAVSLYLFPRIQKAMEGLSLPAAEMSPEDTARAWR